MALAFSVHRFTGTIQSAPNIQPLLRDAAVDVAEIFRREVGLLFGIGCTWARMESAFGEAVEVRHRENARLFGDQRGFVTDIAMGRHNTGDASDPRVVADLDLWDRARAALLGLVTSMRDIELSNVSIAPGRPTLIAYERATGSGAYRMNPFTWARRNPGGRGDPQAWLTMGPAMLLLHETRHQSGCFTPQPRTCRATSGAGLVAQASHEIEMATIADLNAVGRLLELPARREHEAFPGGLTHLHYADGHTVRLWWPNTRQLLGGAPS